MGQQPAGQSHPTGVAAPGGTAAPRGPGGLERIDLDRLAPYVLALATVASGALLYHLTRGSSFWGDDWAWIAYRRANRVHTFLSPYDGHLSVLPLVIYRVMFAVFGISSYVPYRVLVIGLSLVVALLAFTYARARVGSFAGTLVAALVLFAGPAWQDTMWAFQIGWELALALGVAALIMLDRRARASDVAACALIFGSICSTSFGVAFAIGILADVGLIRRRWRDLWIAVVPLVLYGLWALYYHPSGINWSEITLVPTNLVQTFAGGIAGILGLTGATPIDPVGTTLTFGAPLLVLLAVAAVVSARQGRLSMRAISLTGVLILFSTLTTLGRAFETPLVSRYIYPDCVLMALLAVELGRGVRFGRAAQLALATGALLAIVANVAVLRAAGGYLRQVGAATNADVAALRLGRGSVPAGYVAAQLPDYPFVSITAGAYFAAQDALGTPADTIAQLAAAPAGARTTADTELVGEGAIRLSPGVSPDAAAGRAPSVATSTGGSATPSGACVAFAPAAAMTPGASASATLVLAPGAFRVTSGAAPATIAAQRFGPTAVQLGTIGPDRSAIVFVRRDAAPAPWRIQLVSSTAVRACTLG